MLNSLFLVFIGGGVGSIARYLMMQFVSTRVTPGSSFPWHTLSVNVLGSFIIGILIEVLALRVSASVPARLLLVTGLIGGFTTFSTFSMETALMLERGDYLNSGLYIVGSVVGTVIAVFLGAFLARSAM